MNTPLYNNSHPFLLTSLSKYALDSKSINNNIRAKKGKQLTRKEVKNIKNSYVFLKSNLLFSRIIIFGRKRVNILQRKKSKVPKKKR